MLNMFLRDESGATAIEYGLIVTIIGLGIITSLNSVRTGIHQMYVDMAAAVDSR
jgi:pilus assembly protein Flp/PilA